MKDGGREIHRDMIRGVWSSVANLAIAPAQDRLGLSSPARMARRGPPERNWEWRLPPPIAGEARLRLGELTRIYGRSAR